MAHWKCFSAHVLMLKIMFGQAPLSFFKNEIVVFWLIYLIIYITSVSIWVACTHIMYSIILTIALVKEYSKSMPLGRKFFLTFMISVVWCCFSWFSWSKSHFRGFRGFFRGFQTPNFHFRGFPGFRGPVWPLVTTYHCAANKYCAVQW